MEAEGVGDEVAVVVASVDVEDLEEVASLLSDRIRCTGITTLGRFDGLDSLEYIDDTGSTKYGIGGH